MNTNLTTADTKRIAFEADLINMSDHNEWRAGRIEKLAGFITELVAKGVATERIAGELAGKGMPFYLPTALDNKRIATMYARAIAETDHNTKIERCELVDNYVDGLVAKGARYEWFVFPTIG